MSLGSGTEKSRDSGLVGRRKDRDRGIDTCDDYPAGFSSSPLISLPAP